MALHPLAGKPAPRDLLDQHPAAGRPPTTPMHRTPASRASGSPSAPRATGLVADGQLQRGPHPGHLPRRSANTARQQGIDGPLFLGMDTHALSEPAFATALEVFAANGVDVMIQAGRRLHAHARSSPTPSSTYNRGRTERPGRRGRDHALAQPARRRRLQVQPAHGGPADTETTSVDPGAGQRASWPTG